MQNNIYNKVKGVTHYPTLFLCCYHENDKRLCKTCHRAECSFAVANCFNINNREKLGILLQYCKHNEIIFMHRLQNIYR